MDSKWWKVYHREVMDTFAGERLSNRNWHGARQVRTDHATRNSGAGAIAVAARRGAKRIILIGYDCGYSGSKRHWHGDHPPGCAGNAAPRTVAKWPRQFQELAGALPGIDIINASRETALTVFRRMPLEDALA